MVELIKDITSGIHFLSGIDYYTVPKVKDWEEDLDGICFILDGVHYFTVLDPCDGYRSWMDIVKSDENICKRTFIPQEVLIKHEYVDKKYSDREIVLDLYNPYDNSLILHICNGNYDDYYPYADYEYHPENLPENKR